MGDVLTVGSVALRPWRAAAATKPKGAAVGAPAGVADELLELELELDELPPTRWASSPAAPLGDSGARLLG